MGQLAPGNTSASPSLWTGVGERTTARPLQAHVELYWYVPREMQETMMAAKYQTAM